MTTTYPAADYTPATTTTTRERAVRARRTARLVKALAQCTDERERASLCNDLVTTNLKVAESIASRYRSRGIATEDLRQVAFLALTKAAQRFDPASGHDFLAFCVPTIRGELRRHFRDQGWTVRPPRRIQELQQLLNAAQDDLSTRLGRPPSAPELAEALGENTHAVIEALQARGCFTPASLDRPVGESAGSSLGELLRSEDQQRDAAEARAVLAPVVRRLSERDRLILRLRFFDGLTQREVADAIGVTQMQVSRLLSRIFRDLREGLGPIDSPA